MPTPAPKSIARRRRLDGPGAGPAGSVAVDVDVDVGVDVVADELQFPAVCVRAAPFVRG